MRPEAIVIDVDGTLLTSEHHTTRATRAAIRSAHAAGVRVLIASARGPGGLRHVLRALPLSGPLIAFNGALVCRLPRDNDDALIVLREARIAQATALHVVEEAMRLGLEIGWHTGEHWYAPTIGRGSRREAAVIDQQIEPLQDAASREEPHKLLCIADRSRLEALATLQQRLPPDCQGRYSHKNYLEITARDVDKARAVAWWCATAGIAPTAVAAIGDGENDIELLTWAGTGVSMGNAAPALEKVATWTTDTNDRDGLAMAITRLIGLCDDGWGRARSTSVG